MPQALLDKLAPYLEVDKSTLQHINTKTFKMLNLGTHADPESWIAQTGVKPSTISEVYRAWHESPEAYSALYAQKRRHGQPESAAPGQTVSARQATLQSAPGL